MLFMAVLVVLFTLIFRHYRWFTEQIRVDEREVVGVPAAVTIGPGAPKEHVVVPVDDVNKISLGSVGMAREISNLVTAVHVTDDREEAEGFRQRWSRAAPDVPLMIIESPYRAFVAPIIAYIEHLEGTEPDAQITVVLPTVKERHWWEAVLHNRDVLRLRPMLHDRERVAIVEFPYDLNA